MHVGLILIFWADHASDCICASECPLLNVCLFLPLPLCSHQHALLRRNPVIIRYYATDAVRRYRGKYPNRRVPDHPVSLSVDRRLRQTGRFHGMRWDADCPCSVRNVWMVRQILEFDKRQPATSTRLLIPHTGILHAYVHHALQEQQLYPYCIQSARVSTTECTCILSTEGKLYFPRTGISNIHNEQVRSDENPPGIRTHSAMTDLTQAVGWNSDDCPTLLDQVTSTLSKFSMGIF
jgi:hypothetical protein